VKEVVYMMKKFISFLILLIGPVIVSAQTYGSHGGFMEITEGVTEGPVSLLIQIMYGICYIAGTFFMFKAYEAFQGHRFRPETIGISHTLFAAAFGITLLLLPLVHHLVDKFY
jgi:uncharacterized membrane protein